MRSRSTVFVTAMSSTSPGARPTLRHAAAMVSWTASRLALMSTFAKPLSGWAILARCRGLGSAGDGGQGHQATAATEPRRALTAIREESVQVAGGAEPQVLDHGAIHVGR